MAVRTARPSVRCPSATGARSSLGSTSNGQKTTPNKITSPFTEIQMNMKTKHNTLTYLSLALGIALVSTSCTRDNDPDPVIPPSEGSTMTLNGGPGEGAAENSVYVDLSADEQTAVKRESWHIGFYQGSAFRVILNNTMGHAITAKSTGQTDINAVNASNVDIDELAFGLDMNTFEVLGSFDLVDDTTGNITKTAIAEIAAGDNEVYVVHVASGLIIEPANVWKIKVS